MDLARALYARTNFQASVSARFHASEASRIALRARTLLLRSCVHLLSRVLSCARSASDGTWFSAFCGFGRRSGPGTGVLEVPRSGAFVGIAKPKGQSRSVGISRSAIIQTDRAEPDW